MVTLYEGIVTGDLRVPNTLVGGTSTTGSTSLDPLVGTVQVFLEEPQIVVDAVIGSGYGLQLVPQKNSKVLVYRTYNDQARIVAVLADVQPKPIWNYNDSNSSFFQPGEVGIQAIGSPGATIPQDGGSVWCQNSGDVNIYSGTWTQSIEVSDTLSGINIRGTNISLATNTSAIAAHAFTLSTDLDGLSSSQWGIQNPTTGIFLNSISISELGTINLGLSDPVLGTLLEGISVSTTPSILQPLGGISLLTVGDISLTALDISLKAPIISFTGVLSITGGTSVTGLLAVTGDTSINGFLGVTGDTTLGGSAVITGALSVGGGETVAGALSVAGGVSIAGALSAAGGASVTGALNVTGVYSSSGIPGISGTFPIVIGGSIVVAGGLVIAVIP